MHPIPHKRRRYIAWLATAAALVTLAALTPAGCGRRSVPAGGTRTLIVGTDAMYPPLEFQEGGRITGFDIDLGAAVARRMDARVEWVNTGFDGIFAALQAGKFDLVISAVTITPDRRREMAFSEPYHTAGQALASRKAGPIYPDMASLAGKTVGIQIGTSALEVLKKHPRVRVRQYNSIDLALLDLENGRVAAVMTDSPVLRYMLHRSFDSLVVAGSLLSTEQYGIAMRRGDAELLRAVNAALKDVKASGELAAIEARWFGGEPRVPRRSTRQLLGIVTPALARAALTTLQLAFLALLCGLPIGLLVALMRIAHSRVLRLVAGFYVQVLRGTPLLVQVFTVYYVLPAMGVELGQWPAALLAFSLNSSAYVAEILRAGIQSVDTGQMEAARSLGMPYGMAMRLVVLPQAARRVLPPLTNESIALLKDTSLVSVIALVELTREGQQLTGSLAVPMLVWPMVGLFYLLLTVPLTALSSALERRWHVGGTS